MLNSRDSVASLRAKLDFIEQIDSPQQLQQIAQKYQQQPNGAAIISAALARAQDLKKLQSGILASDKAGSVGAPPITSQAIASINPRALPEDVGIGRLPAPNIARMAEGGIVAFAGGGIPKGDRMPSFDEALDVEGVDDPKARAFLKALYGQESGSGADTRTSNRGAVGHMQILPGTFTEVASQDMDINNPFDNMRAGIRYGLKGLRAAKGDPVLAGAHYYGGLGGMKALAAGKERIDPENPTYPNTRQYGKEIARRMAALLPIGSAQAEPLPPPKGQTTQAAPSAQTVSPADDGTVYDPMTGVPVYQGTPTPYAVSPAEILKEMAAPVVKGVTKAAKVITSAPKTRAELEKEADAKRERFSTGEYRGKSGDPDEDIGPAQAPLPPKKEKELIAAAKEAIPASERKGWTNDMLLQFFLSMAAGESPNTAKNIATAGLVALQAGREAKKAEMEQRKMEQEMALSKAHEKYYGAAAQRYEAEDRPLAQLRKEIAAAYLKLEADPLLKLDPAKLAAEKRRVAAELSANYPELADTIGVGGAGFKVLGSRG